jgi:hypothetical protein
MDQSRNHQRLILIRLIVVLALVQAGILAYLWRFLRPTAPQPTAEPTSAQFELPTAADTPVPSGRVNGSRVQPTPTPDLVRTVVGPLVPATNHTHSALMFDEEMALEHIAHLASAELGGRQPGTSGGWAAGDYIAAAFAEYGLQPAGVNNSYFQTFTVPYGRITAPPVLTLSPPQATD